MKYAKLGSVAVIVAALLWSVDGLLRRNLYDLPPSVVVFYEHLFGLIILFPLILFSLKAFKKLTRKQWLAIIGVSFLSGALGTILYTAALGQIQYIPFSVVVLLQQLNPVFAIVAAAILLKEPLTRKFFGLAALALVAAYFVAFPDYVVNLDTGSGTALAALFAVGAAAAWGTSTAFSKYALKGTSFVHITAARFAFTPIFALLFVGISGSAPQLTTLSPAQLLYIVAITFSTGLIALLIYYFGLQRVPASRAAILELAWPLSAVVVGYLFLNQTLELSQAIAAIVLTTVIILIAKDSQKQSQASTKTQNA